jgi:hypothetical protein
MSWLSNLLSPSPLPSQYTAVQALQPGAQTTGQQLETTGQQLQTKASPLIRSGESYLATGASELASAQAGVLTPEEQAQLSQQQTLQTDQAMQMYASEGRSPTKDTSFLGTTEAISANMMAAAQNFIQSNIALAGQMITLGGQTISAGLGLFSAGAQDFGEGLAFETQGANELIAAGTAQTQLDTSYTQAVSSAFSAVAGMFGTAVGGKTGIGFGNLFGGSSTPSSTPKQ